MRDYWRNIVHTIMLQKWRSLMTAFGVFWGILILVVIMGVGKGMKRGCVGRMLKLPIMIEYWANPTSLEYKGFPIGRNWSFDDRGIDLLEEKYPQQIKSVSRLCIIGDQLVGYETRSSHYFVNGISPEYPSTYPQQIIAGRAIDRNDIDEMRKVCVIGDDVASFFDAQVGQPFKINNVKYTIVGITRCTNKPYAESHNPSQMVYIPVTVAQLAFGYGTKLDGIVVNMANGYSSIEYKPEIDKYLHDYYNLHPDDLEALTFFDSQQFINERNVIDIGFDILLWLIGIGTLAAGLIGIANIMLVSIRERTQEIGIYRALGAQPGTIIRMILAESMLLTLSAGIAGLTLGIYLIALVRRVVDMTDVSDAIVHSPYVPVNIALISLLILVAGGLISGYIPVHNALKIKPIDALKSE